MKWFLAPVAFCSQFVALEFCAAQELPTAARRAIADSARIAMQSYAATFSRLDGQQLLAWMRADSGFRFIADSRAHSIIAWKSICRSLDSWQMSRASASA
jgi:hypothetical protein